MKRYIIYILLLCSSLCAAEEVKVLLRSGTVITGDLILQNDEVVIVRTAGGTRFQLPATEVVKIGTPDEIFQTVAEQKPDTMPASAEPAPKPALINAGYNDPYRPVDPTPASQAGRIYRDGSKYMYNNTYIDSKEVERILYKNNSGAYKAWQKGNGMLVGGAVLTGVGVGLALGSLAWMINSPNAAVGIACGGVVCAIPGCVLLITGSAKKNKAIDIYNSKYDGTPITLNVVSGSNGIGLAINF